MGTHARLLGELANGSDGGDQIGSHGSLTLHPTLQTECLLAEELHQWWLHAYR